IFSVEDDAQDGPDHVDAHRSTAFVISPYTQTGVIDSTFYSSVSVLRTMELVLGVPPMSQFDAVATPMSAAFSGTATRRPYTADANAQPSPSDVPRTSKSRCGPLLLDRTVGPDRRFPVFFRYLSRELRRRSEQALVVSLGLAVGIGLVVAVSAMATGVQRAQGT